MPDKVKISASILAADFTRLGDEVRRLEDAGCDELHFDVMDGHFVPNISFGPVVLEAVRRLTALPVDVHMMVTEPGRYAQAFCDAGASVFTVHAEACKDLESTLGEVRGTGMAPAVSLKPATPVKDIRRLLNVLDRVLVMTVEPGFGGQSFMPEMLPKIEELREIATSEGMSLEIAVDGGVKVENARSVIRAGGGTLISGTGIFNYPEGMAAAVRKMRESRVDRVVPGDAI